MFTLKIYILVLSSETVKNIQSIPCLDLDPDQKKGDVINIYKICLAFRVEIHD